MKILGLIFGFFCAFIGWSLAKIQIGSQDAKPATFDRFDGSCPGHDVPITYDLQAAKSVGTNLMLNTTVTVKEDIQGDHTFSMTMQRCKAKENLDTCEPFKDFQTNRYCSYIQSDSMLHQSFLTAFAPPWRCPLKTGVYHGINGTLDVAAFMILPGESWFWRFEAELRQKRTNRLLTCLSVDAYVTYR